MTILSTHVNYCMKAQAFLRHRTTKKVVGHFCTYDKNPECFSAIRHLCKIHESPDLECTEVEVTLYDVCPHREDTIDVVFYADSDNDDDDDGSGHSSGSESGYDGSSDEC